jgi:uncharacterized protein
MTRKATQTLVGVISDTHSLLRPEVLPVFNGVDLIVHAGDLGDRQILDKLRDLAPVVAVRGNNDTGEWARKIPKSGIQQVGDIFIYILHNLNELDLSPQAAGFQVVVSGHSHKPILQEKDGVLYLNPGSAGPRRFKLPISIGRLHIKGKTVQGELIQLG